MKLCDADDCTRPARTPGAKWCNTHHSRMYQHGSLDPTRVVRPSQGICTADGCEQPDKGPHGLCGKHRERLRRHGDLVTVLAGPGVLSPTWVGDDISYRGAHMRVRAQRGRVEEHDCVDCGEQAAHWSYDHDDSNEKRQDGMAYSPDPDHYSPRCVSCHKRFDLDLIGAR